jgi:DNA-directed RNA polymerase subunit RPC12/RpoP
MCADCELRTKRTYEMVGTCSNCGKGSVRMIFRFGDTKRPLDCPTCGARRLTPMHLVAPEEMLK